MTKIPNHKFIISNLHDNARNKSEFWLKMILATRALFSDKNTETI